MPLNDIHLNPQLLADLYRNSLVEADIIQDADRKIPVPDGLSKVDGSQPQPQFNYLGNNKKNILLLVKYKDVAHLPDQQLNFITSILTACKLGLGDIALFNLAD